MSKNENNENQGRYKNTFFRKIYGDQQNQVNDENRYLNKNLETATNNSEQKNIYQPSEEEKKFFKQNTYNYKNNNNIPEKLKKNPTELYFVLFVIILLCIGAIVAYFLLKKEHYIKPQEFKVGKMKKNKYRSCNLCNQNVLYPINSLEVDYGDKFPENCKCTKFIKSP